MRPLQRKLAIGLAAFACACQSAIEVSDQRPDFMAKQQLSSVVWLGLSDNGKHITNSGSGIIVSPNRILTNAHVWSKEDPWWGSELPKEQQIYMFQRGKRRTVLVKDENGDEGSLAKDPKIVTTRYKLVATKFRLVASGEIPRIPPSKSTPPQRPPILWTKDWALLETDQPLWSTDDVAIVHPAAKNPAWVPQQGTDAYIAGFSSVFMNKPPEEGKTSLKNLMAFIADGPYVVHGKVKHIETLPASEQTPMQPMVTYPPGWPKPGGHSGGGVYLWNTETGQPELIGVFHTQNATTSWFTLFGMRLIGSDEWSLGYTPLSFVGDALE